MARMVQCVKLGREAEGLDFPPYPGELGKRIYESVSKEAWAAVAAPPDDARQRESPEPRRRARAQVARRADGEALLRRRRGDAVRLRSAFVVMLRRVFNGRDAARTAG